jgi:lysophospholipase L1-like esterase
MKFFLTRTYLLIFIILSTIQNIVCQSENPEYKFDFGNGMVKDGFTQVTGDMRYDSLRGFGFISDTVVSDVIRDIDDSLLQDFCTSSRPFYFLVDLPEGNYQIVLTIGDKDAETFTTVKAESRRLMIQSVKTEAGEYVTKSITVNVRTPRIDSINAIRLKSREYTYLNWDNKLILEFNNSRPCINGLEISPAKDALQVFLAGNSTVVDQEYEPWCSWGQMIPNFFSNELVVVNLAESGEALKSFKWENRLKKLLSMLDSGDYVFIEFGHNDQKPQSSAYVEAFTGYKEELKDYIQQVKTLGGNPVLVSPTQRRSFDSLGFILNTHGDYPLAMKETAQEESVPFIDLNAMSKVLFETLGEEDSKKAFVHYPPNTFPGQEKALADNSHFNNYGAYQLAKCILQGIIDQNLELKNYIIRFEGYDPAKPDDYSNFYIPESPFINLIKPDGY